MKSLEARSQTDFQCTDDVFLISVLNYMASLAILRCLRFIFKDATRGILCIK